MKTSKTKQNIDALLFNGHIREPIPIAILASFVGVVLLVLAIFAASEIIFTPSYESSLKEVQFIEYKQDGPIYLLYSSESDIYHLPVASLNDSSLLDSLIDQNVTVSIEYIFDRKETPSDILSVTNLDGTHIISSNDISRARWNASVKAAIAMCFVNLAYWSFVVSSYYFISHAPSYPKIAALLVRKSFRNF